MKNKSLIVASLTVITLGGLLPCTTQAALAPASVTAYGVDDWNTSSLIPNTVNGGKNTPDFYTGACPWITSAMDSFVASHANFTYQWAAPSFDLKSDLTVTDYAPWVVTSPNTANGFNLAGGFANSDAGGADFGLTYTPTANNSPQNIFFIQAYIENINGTQNTAKLDNGNAATPWYGGASSYGNGGAASKMADEPGDAEPNAFEPATGVDPVYFTNVQFQTVVAVDNVVDGKNNLTLYKGSEWWGYNYVASDVDEPSTMLLFLVGLSYTAIRKLRLTKIS